MLDKKNIAKQIIYRNQKETYRIQRLSYNGFGEEILEGIPRGRKVNGRRLNYGGIERGIRSNPILYI